MHPIVELAKKTVEMYVRTGNVPGFQGCPEFMTSERAGVFVSLHIGDDLRGCIGTIEPLTDCVAEEVVRNAVAAATQDPRFPAVMEAELSRLEYSVDVLTEPVEVKDVKELDPKRYGVIVSKGRCRGLLLPDLEGVDTVERQLSIAMAKAGIWKDEDCVKVEKFEVTRYK